MTQKERKNKWDFSRILQGVMSGVLISSIMIIITAFVVIPKKVAVQDSKIEAHDVRITNLEADNKDHVSKADLQYEIQNLKEYLKDIMQALHNGEPLQ